jgi:tRNA-dihydrouridine synthase 3
MIHDANAPPCCLCCKPKYLSAAAAATAYTALLLLPRCNTGESERKQTAAVLVPLLARAGAAAVAVHGRTAEQRYKKAADWDAISRLAAATPNVAIIGNGDLLTHYEVQRRRSTSGCAALMAGRGALIKPWLFEEVKQAGLAAQGNCRSRARIWLSP